MSLNKQFLKSKPVCKVKFRLEGQETNGCEEFFVVGDFNEWNEKACPMNRLKDGSFSATLDLETGREYRFRYLGICTESGAVWCNEPQADRHEYCSYASADNSVITL